MDAKGDIAFHRNMVNDPYLLKTIEPYGKKRIVVCA
jgi:hypothetical protein